MTRPKTKPVQRFALRLLPRNREWLLREAARTGYSLNTTINMILDQERTAK